MIQFSNKIVGVDSSGSTRNPTMKQVDWQKNFIFSNLKASVLNLNIEPNQSVTVFDGSIPSNIGALTAFDLIPKSNFLYRLKSSGGPSPAFRVESSVNLNSVLTSISIGANFSATVTVATPQFASGVFVGDKILIPGLTTGDLPSVFGIQNEGDWEVLSIISPTVLQMVRPQGQAFLGASISAVTPLSSSAFRVFSSAGIQKKQTIEFVSGFGFSGKFLIEYVAPDYLEFKSTKPLPSLVNQIPGISGIRFQSKSLSFIHVESQAQLNFYFDSAVAPIVLAVPSSGNLGIFSSTVNSTKIVLENKNSTKLEVFIVLGE